MIGTIIGIILTFVIVLFAYACCKLSSECDKWEEEYLKKQEMKKGGKRK